MEQGLCSGESTRLSTMWPGFKSQHLCHMWVEFVVGSLLCSKRFFSEYSSFLNSNSTIREIKNHYKDVLPLNRYLFYLLFIYFLVSPYLH